MSSAMIAMGIDKLSVPERISLVQDIWDSIPDDEQPVELSDGQKSTLLSRLAELDADPTNVLTWEQIKARVRAGK